MALAEPPADGVTALRFAADGASLLASSWDASVRLYDARTNQLRTKLKAPCPVLDCDFADEGGARAASGGLDGAVRLHGLAGDAEAVALGVHGGAVKCVRRAQLHGGSVLVSGSWDKTVKLWDARAASACVGTHAQPDKVLSLCAGAASGGGGASGAPTVIVATHGRHVLLVDLRKPSEPVQRRESSLKSQTRVVATMPSGEGFALGSVEGRVAVEYVDPSEASQARKFAFKCHRAMVDGADVAYPVNAIAFHPVHGTFATGGADGLVYVWDPEKKKRVSSLKPYPTGVAALAFSPAGDRLAVAASYGYERGDAEHPPDAIHVRKVGEAEVKPKAKAKAK